jgi:hypothetical protein
MEGQNEAVRTRKPWTVKYDGRCSRCSLILRRGEVAVYERGTNTIRCVHCPSGAIPPPDAIVDPGTPGAAARREHERRRAKDDAALRERFGRFGGLAVALAGQRQSTRAWATGALGEETLGALLTGRQDIRALHDRRVRGTRGNIDHLVIAPAGVFVVDAKNLRGTIRIRDRGGLFRSDPRLYVGRRDQSKLAEGLRWQMDVVVSALLATGLAPPPVTPVLCFIDGQWPALFPPSEYMGVRLEGPNSLQRLLTEHQLFDQPAIDALTRTLATAFPPK